MLLVKNEIPWHVLTIKQYNINFYWLGAMQIYKQFSWTFFNIARADSLAQKLLNHDTFIIIIHTIQQPVYSIINNIYIFRLNGINHTRSKDRVKANKSIGISCFRFHTNYYYFTEKENKKKHRQISSVKIGFTWQDIFRTCWIIFQFVLKWFTSFDRNRRKKTLTKNGIARKSGAYIGLYRSNRNTRLLVAPWRSLSFIGLQT